MITGCNLDENIQGALRDTGLQVQHETGDPRSIPATTRNKTTHLLITVFTEVDQDILECYPTLEAIITLSAGFDHIDLQACEEAGVKTYRTAHYGDHTVAEHAFMLLLAHERKLLETQGKPKTLDRTQHLGTELYGKTLGILGVGGIGSTLAEIANGFSMEVKGYDVQRHEELEANDWFTYTTIQDICRTSDYVSLHLPLLPETKHTVDQSFLAGMKPDAIIINTGRAGLIDHDALLEALQNNEVRGAVLDVVPSEKRETLQNQQNVLITPHHAFYTREALRRIAEMAEQVINNAPQPRLRVN